MRDAFRIAVLAIGLGLSMPTMAQVQKEPQSDLDKIGDSAERMATKPLKDLNLIKPKTPQEIKAILEEPYNISKLKTCAQKKAAEARLTEVLGPDIDSAEARNKKGKNPGEFALSMGESAVGSLIPGMGLIRKITGAEAEQKRAEAAVLSGMLRRAYIKGAGRARGCKF